MNRDVISCASSGDNTVITNSSTHTIQIYALAFTLASSTTVTLKSGSTALTGAMTGTAFVFDVRPIPRGGLMPWFNIGPGQNFVINLGGAVQCSGQVTYGIDNAEAYD